MQINKKLLFLSAILLVMFAAVILAVKFIDVKPIGPQNSEIGLATLNGAMHALFGTNLLWYHITDWLGVVAIAVAFSFAVLGACQLIIRKKADVEIVMLGFFYVAVIAAYIFFEIFIVNYRPIIMYTDLEASFPSSHTMIVVCIMGTASYQFKKRLTVFKSIAVIASYLVIAVTVIGRLISGAHWFTDIIGGLLISGGLVSAYLAICNHQLRKKRRKVRRFTKKLSPFFI